MNFDACPNSNNPHTILVGPRALLASQVNKENAMVKSSMFVVSFALITVLSLPVFAQDVPAKAAVATVQVDGGVIMVSDGGAFTSATTGEQVAAGNRIMVSKDSAVSVVYSDGCKQSYTKPGVYPIVAQCKPAASVGNAGEGWNAAAVAIGVAGAGGVIGGLLSNSHCNSGSHCSGTAPSR
jgi:hypothetical protein